MQWFDETEKRALSMNEFAFRFGIPPTAARELVRKGKVPTVRVGSHLVVRVEEADKFFNEAIAQSAR